MRQRPVAVLDLEVYYNFFLVALKDLSTRRLLLMEYPLDLDHLRKVLCHYRVVTFNGTGYDIPILMYALSGATTEQLKHASNRIIDHNLQPWIFGKEFNVTMGDPSLDHVDLMGVAKGKASLKMYGARMNSQSIQDLPYHPDTILTDEQKAEIKQYCVNDLRITEDLYHELQGQLALRTAIGWQYNINVMSRSDAQIAETVIKTEIERQTGYQVSKPEVDKRVSFHYQVPSWVSFSTLDILDHVRQAEFQLTNGGKVVIPKELAKKKISIGDGIYRMSIGGLHSSEECVSYRSDENFVLIDKDVASYYPAILLNERLYPKNLGPIFSTVYRTLVEKRLEAKRNAQAVKRASGPTEEYNRWVTEAESRKIFVNGLFGKLGNPYSLVYSPELMIQVTVTGQLAILMLVEALENYGIRVVSANTDGVCVFTNRERLDRVNSVIKEWETTTGFVMEETEYSSLHIRDVNDYIAIKADGHSTKIKGVYGPGLTRLEKNPVASICVDAVVDCLTLDADIESTVRCCTDVTKFLSVRKVTGGAVWRGQPLGRVVRWYYTNDLVGDAIYYKTNGNQVGTTEGAHPMMRLPDPTEGMPDDLDYEWYIDRSHNILKEIGVTA